MNTDVKEFLSLRNAIYREKSEIEARLREINSALGNNAGNGQIQPVTAKREAISLAEEKGHGRGRRNALSLKEAVLKVTEAGALTKEQILEGVQKLGYRFATKDPLNSLGVILYGKNPRFRNEAGRFKAI
jgi:hypothetical protein